MPGADVLPFHRMDSSLAERAIVLFAPGPGSSPTHLRVLYRAATGDTETETDPDRQLARTFYAPRAACVVAMSGRVAQPPLGFTLAVPVATPQELAEALAVNRLDAHVRDTLGQKRSWALLVAVHGSVRQLGIGRALANCALNAIHDAGGEHLYLAARIRGAWTTPWLFDCAFCDDGVTHELHPRTIFSRDVDFSF